jgi:hypothetical protein
MMTNSTCKLSAAVRKATRRLPVREEWAEGDGIRNKDKPKVFAASKRIRSPLLLGIIITVLIRGAASYEGQRRRLPAPLFGLTTGTRGRRSYMRCEICGKYNKDGNYKKLDGCGVNIDKDVCGGLNGKVCKNCREKSKWCHNGDLKCWLCFLCSAGKVGIGSWVTFRKKWAPRLKNILKERKLALDKLKELANGTSMQYTTWVKTQDGYAELKNKYEYRLKFVGTDFHEYELPNGENNHDQIKKWITKFNLKKENYESTTSCTGTVTGTCSFKEGEIVRVSYNIDKLVQGDHVFINNIHVGNEVSVIKRNGITQRVPSGCLERFSKSNWSIPVQKVEKNNAGSTEEKKDKFKTGDVVFLKDDSEGADDSDGEVVYLDEVEGPVANVTKKNKTKTSLVHLKRLKPLTREQWVQSMQTRKRKRTASGNFRFPMQRPDSDPGRRRFLAARSRRRLLLQRVERMKFLAARRRRRRLLMQPVREHSSDPTRN